MWGLWEDWWCWFCRSRLNRWFTSVNICQLVKQLGETSVSPPFKNSLTFMLVFSLTIFTTIHSFIHSDGLQPLGFAAWTGLILLSRRSDGSVFLSLGGKRATVSKQLRACFYADDTSCLHPSGHQIWWSSHEYSVRSFYKAEKRVAEPLRRKHHTSTPASKIWSAPLFAQQVRRKNQQKNSSSSISRCHTWVSVTVLLHIIAVA